MMKTDAELKWQSFADGELSAKEQVVCARILESDPEARAVVAELHRIRQTMRGNELEHPLPVSGEFYWSPIEARLTAAPEAPAPRISRAFQPAWWRWLVPLGSTAALALLLLHLMPARPTSTFVAGEIDTQLPDANFFTFRSLSDGISVVWVDTQAGYTILSPPEDNDYLMQ